MHNFIVFCASPDLRSALILQVTFAITDFVKHHHFISLFTVVSCEYYDKLEQKEHSIRNRYRDNTWFRIFFSILHTKEIYLGVQNVLL